MAIKDIRSNLKPNLALKQNVSGDGRVSGSIIDTAKFDLGIVFTFHAEDYTDGNHTPVIEEDDLIGFASPSDIEQGRLIGTPANEVIDGAAAEGDELGSLGCFGNKRFVRLSFDSDTVTTGADLVAYVHQKAEILPAKV